MVEAGGVETLGEAKNSLIFNDFEETCDILCDI